MELDDMCNKEQLVSYLYDDLSASGRIAFERHASQCAECRGEIEQLRQTRQHLASWAPPEPDFNFRILREPIPELPRRKFSFVPAWGLAAAASVLVVAGAAAIANVEVRYGSGGLVVRTGWAAAVSEGAEASPASAADDEVASKGHLGGPSNEPAAVSAHASSEQLMEAVEALQNRLRDLEQAHAKQAAALQAALKERPDVSAAELKKILAESELRHRTEMALQIAQVWKDFNVARTSDYARIQEMLGRAQGLTNAQLRQHRESIESLGSLYTRVSMQK
jgi:hypothetical protein